MRKISLIFVLLILISILSIGCSKNNGPPPETGYKRNVVIEIFSYHGCPNCPAAEKAVDSLFGIYGDSLVVIEYHAVDTIFGDSLSRPCSVFVKDREVLYSVGGYPTVVFDGVEEHIGGSGDLFSIFLNIIENRFSKKSDLKIQTLEANFVDETSISFNLRIVSETDISGKLFIVLTEDSVVFKDSLYHFVAKQVYPDENGMDFSIFEEDTFGANGSILLSWQPAGDVWLNIFIQNMGDNTIFQGGSVNLGKSPAIPYEFEFSVSPDSFQTVLPGDTAHFFFFLEHTGTIADEYEMVASQIDTVSGWMWLMCAGGLCYVPSPTITDTFSIDPEEIDTFDIKVITNTTTGTEKINVKVTSFGDTTVTESINIYTEVQ